MRSTEDEFLYEDPEEVEYQRKREAERTDFEKWATRRPQIDYYERYRPEKPKREIGGYIASQGFDVPLITSLEEWQEAFDTGTAMLRSELSQDYDGLSGLFPSTVLSREEVRSRTPGTSAPYREFFTDVIADGLYNGDLHGEEYMELFEWNYAKEQLWSDLNQLGIHYEYRFMPSVSAWRYVPGINLKVFQDPTVEGRYHIGTKVGGFQFDPEGWDTKLEYEYRKMKSEIDVRKVIDFYESVRTLPRFDTTQSPLLEVQQDRHGELRFLQYFKTGKRVDPVEAFELPSEAPVRSEVVRGATDPDGEDLRIYITPKRATRRMRGQAAFFDLTNPGEFAQQYFSATSKVIIHEAYIGLYGNHFSIAPMIRPQVAIGLERGQSEPKIKFEELSDLTRNRSVWEKNPDHEVYIDAKITSNGREATIETDWQPKFEPYN